MFMCSMVFANLRPKITLHKLRLGKNCYVIQWVLQKFKAQNHSTQTALGKCVMYQWILQNLQAKITTQTALGKLLCDSMGLQNLQAKITLHKLPRHSVLCDSMVFLQIYKIT